MKEHENTLDLTELVDDSSSLCTLPIPLFDVLAIAITYTLCDLEDFEDLDNYLENFGKKLTRRFQIERIPSERTIRRVLAAIKPEQLGMAILHMLRQRLDASGDITTADGEATRSTGLMDEHTLQTLVVCEGECSMIIGQLDAESQRQGIPEMIDFLEQLKLAGRIVSLDAVYCQEEISALISGELGDYVFQVKENQPFLLEITQYYMDDLIKDDDSCLDVFRSQRQGKDRHEVTTCYMAPAPVDDEPCEWSDLNTMIAVDHEWTQLETGETGRERTYYISSLLGTAQHLLEIIRSQSQAESLPWSLAVVFQEEACRKYDPRLSESLNVLSKLALAVHKDFLAKMKAAEVKKFMRRSMKMNMKSCSSKVDMLIEVLQNCDLKAVEAEFLKSKTSGRRKA
ncbi:MAG: ISAs1 family transposase [Bacillota bacterium]|nr:ISAs1 family transposase [Bacillota bacterium]